MTKKGFKDLLVWQKAKELAILIYRISQGGAFGRDFTLRDQIRRSALSIPSNIGEGDERNTHKESIRFFYIAKGSLAELRTQLEIANEIGYLNKQVYEDLEAKCVELGKMIGSLIKARHTFTSCLFFIACFYHLNAF
jgi:four helix bundle protein